MTAVAILEYELDARGLKRAPNICKRPGEATDGRIGISPMSISPLDKRGLL
jgi:hypothetical protein